MENEKTEELLTKEEPKKEGRKKSKKTWFIVLGVLLVLLIAAGVGYYFYYRENQYNKQITLGEQYLKEEDYANAVLAFNEAIKISERKPEGFVGLAKADTYLGEVEEASQSYLKAYELTEETLYQSQAESVYYGNSNGNIVNGGNVVEQVDTSYILENGVTQANIWKEKDGEQELVKTVGIEESPAQNLNIQGRYLYYLNNAKLYSYNLDTEEEKAFEINENILQYLVYSDRIYCLTEKALISIKPDGSDRKDIISFEQQSFKFIYQDKTIYLVTTDEDFGSSKLYSISTESPELMELYSSDTAVITGLVYRDAKILFKLTSSGETPVEALYELDPETKEVTELIQPGVVSSINIDEENLFYIADRNLYRADFDGKNETLISEIPQQETTDYYFNEINSINITSSDVYVINSVSEDRFSSVGYKNNVLTTELDDPKQLDSIELSGNTEELVDPEPPFPVAYEEILNNYRVVLNGGSVGDNLINLLGYRYLDSVRAPLGYCLVDINYDGIQELLLGHDQYINAMYTLVNGKAAEVFVNSDIETVISLTTNNQLVMFVLSNPADIFTLKGSELQKVKEYAIDRQTYDFIDPDNGKVYTYEELEDLYPKVWLEYIAL